MHEYSIVQSLIDSSIEHAYQNSANRVTKIVVKIGNLSGVDPHLLEVAFDTFKENTICSDAILVINLQKVLIKCNECQKESILEVNEFLCSFCKSSNVNVLDGEDMFLMQLELE